MVHVLFFCAMHSFFNEINAINHELKFCLIKIWVMIALFDIVLYMRVLWFYSYFIRTAYPG